MPGLRDISLTQLGYFARCAELSSMKDAAASLHVAQSAVSTSIGNLERRLGTPLFVRRRAKGLVLTAAGETFLVRTRRILADIDDAMAAVDPRHRFTSFEAVRAMVARGHGFTLLNQRPVHDLTYDGGRLVVIKLEEEAGSLDIVLASAQPMRTLSRRAQAFVVQCRAVVAAQAMNSLLEVTVALLQ